MAPRNKFPSREAGGSAREAFAITPDDDVDLDEYPRALWIGGEGDVAVIFTAGSEPVVFKNVAAGYMLMISPSRVVATGTTATNIVGVV